MWHIIFNFWDRLRKEPNIYDDFYANKKALKDSRNKRFHNLSVEKAHIICGGNSPRPLSGGGFKTARSPEEWENQNRLIDISEQTVATWQNYYRQKEDILQHSCADMKHRKDYFSANLLETIENFKTNLGCFFSATRAKAHEKHKQAQKYSV